MTDAEIIKTLECCINDDCDNCPNGFGNCEHNLAKLSIDLINRQKAEIERLTNKCEDCAGCSEWKCDCSNIRNYAIRDFAEILKEVGTKVEGRKGFEGVFVMANNFQIDNLVAEMVGDTERGSTEF